MLAVGVPAAIFAVPALAAQRLAVGSVRTGTVELAARPAHPRPGQPIRFVVLHAPPAATDYRWNLGGDPGSELDTGAVARTAAVFPAGGAHTISVRVSTATGTETGSVTLVVQIAPIGPSPEPRPAPSPTPTPNLKPAPAPTAKPAPPRPVAGTGTGTGTGSERHGALPGASRALLGGIPRHAAVAHAAGDPGVTIADFNFTPGTTTVHVGQTITWTNDGPSAHTATATNGSFDTGTLNKGQSGSHTFTQPGTFSYFCRIHPFMHGTIVVLASSTTTPTTTTTPAASSQSSTVPASTAATSSSLSSTPQTGAATLPMTGMNIAAALLVGLALLGTGLTLRLTRPRRQSASVDDG